MTTLDELVVLEAEVSTLSGLEAILGEYPFKGFPIVQSEREPILLGYIARPELEHALSASLFLRSSVHRQRLHRNMAANDIF